ncbi:serine protease [Kribbella sp. NPDC050281]|uniref:serine protease n=1 Tax=Kribbella sp. NPDC050281 TaxID=3155515 RepID=UPI0033FA8C24
MRDTGASWPDRLRAATAVFDWNELADIADQYVRHLRSTEDLVPQAEASQMLGLLRGVRRYVELHAIADALLGHGLNDAVVKRQFAQALVDRDSPAAALLIYRGILDDPATPEAERPEAIGGIGRCFKQLYLLDQVRARQRRHLPAALAAYHGAYDADHRNYWHGINIAALLARADRDGVEVAGVADAGAESRRVAQEVLDLVLHENPSGVWELATACEAAVALGDHDLAIARATMLVSRPEVDTFTIASLLRQLIELWKLDADDLPGQILVPLLRSAVLGREGGTVIVPARDTRAERSVSVAGYESTEGRNLEAVLGRERFKGMQWWLTGLERCRAVARIESMYADAIGTGFLVSGKQLSPDLPDVVLVTNGHVVPEDLPYGQAFAVFHGLVGDRESARRKFEVVRWWWYQSSRAPNLDIAILELEAYPSNVTPLPVAVEMPYLKAKTKPRAYLIGHPSGWDTPQFSLQDNLLIDYDDTMVHYRSPTEPGSSGSPVFDSTWSLIAVHHAGGLETPRLHGDGGTYPANEGISMAAIKARLTADPPQGRDVARQA